MGLIGELLKLEEKYFTREELMIQLDTSVLKRQVSTVASTCRLPLFLVHLLLSFQSVQIMLTIHYHQGSNRKSKLTKQTIQNVTFSQSNS